MIFTHSLASDWNHGHVHFLRGVVRNLLEAGHRVDVYEPADAWSVHHLRQDHGQAALDAYADAYPMLPATRRVFDPDRFDVTAAVRDADLVIVQEWADPELVRRIGDAVRRIGGPRLYFHDAHHRSLTAPDQIAQLPLDHYDAVLAFGEVVRKRYLEAGWTPRAYTWHEAADTAVFRPQTAPAPQKDLVWIGNWGDEERTQAFRRFLLDPVRHTQATGTIHGVRYPQVARRTIEAAGLDMAGYLPNHRVPEAFAAHRMTVHLPRRAYLEDLPGVPTIRVFEALACGIPLVSLPWQDAEGLFRRGKDHLVAEDGREMAEWIEVLRDDADLRERLSREGIRSIRERHTCRHRVEELMQIDRHVRGGLIPPRSEASQASTRPHAATAGDGGSGGKPLAAAPTGNGDHRDEGPDMVHARATATPSEDAPSIAFFGSSLVSSYWNGACTYYRGLLRALAGMGCRITFYEPDAYDRQRHRDMPDPDWARVVVYPAEGTKGVQDALESARDADIVVKASGVGVHDAYLEAAVLRLQDADTRVLFWDVDAPATLDRLTQDPDDPFHALIPRYDLICTYGGGPRVVSGYESLGARRCVPVYNGVDPETHHPVPEDPRFQADLSFLGNRLPDREERVERFFLDVAKARPDDRFLLGGNGWDARPLPLNVHHHGHVPTADHNAFNTSARAVLNIHRDSMARFGWSPATRVFEAAGAGACIITDHSEGLEAFFKPDDEILVANDPSEVVELLDALDADTAHRIGTRARKRVLRDHTYQRRARQVMELLGEPVAEVIR